MKTRLRESPKHVENFSIKPRASIHVRIFGMLLQKWHSFSSESFGTEQQNIKTPYEEYRETSDEKKRKVRGTKFGELQVIRKFLFHNVKTLPAYLPAYLRYLHCTSMAQRGVMHYRSTTRIQACSEPMCFAVKGNCNYKSITK